jgi:hypothetical protein
MDLEAPEMAEEPEETTIMGVLTGPPPVQSGEDGDNEHDSNGPPPPLSPHSDYGTPVIATRKTMNPTKKYRMTRYTTPTP